MLSQNHRASLLVGKSIVTIEDDGMTQMQLKQVLSRAGLRVIGQAYTGVEGIEVVLRERPDLVLIDIAISGIDGIESTRRILERHMACVVVLTAYPDAQRQERARDAGARGYVLKPVIAETLLPALERACAEHSDGR